MDKQLIAKYLAEAQTKVCGAVEQTMYVIERIDSERGNSIVEWRQCRMCEIYSKPGVYCSACEPLFLSQTIPEGMALVHTELNPKQREIFASAFEHGKCILFADLWRDLLAAAQGERNAD